MRHHALDAPSLLPEIVGSSALSRLLIHFTVRPFERVHFRELKRRTGLANRSLQLQIRRLLDLGMITERRDGRTVSYAASRSHQGWSAIKPMVAVFASPVEVFEIVLAGFPAISSIRLQSVTGSWGQELRVVVDADESSMNQATDAFITAGRLLGKRTHCVIHDGSPVSESGVLLRTPDATA